MEKSIETIWKEGFLKNDALVAPKLNDLYNQKSQHIIEKFKLMGKRNLQWIVVGSVVILVVTFLVGVPWIGAFISLILLYLVRVGMNQARELNKIDSSVNSYQYLKSFNQWLKKSKKEFQRIYRFVYPLLFLALMLGMVYHDAHDNRIIDMIMNNPGTYIIYGMPVFWTLGLVLAVGVVALFSDKIYKFDINVIYGRILDKLKDMLRDMEELSK